jgi:prepilin-type N-terminal cleavage/methylation domain-containing protein
VKDKGFSLIELVIVLVIIGLSISLVMPYLSRFSKTIELKAAAKKISGILRYYRSEAIQQGKVHQVLFDSNLREVRIQALELNEEKVLKNKYPLPLGIQIREMDIPSPQYPADFPVIEFYPSGGSNGGSILLDSQDRKGFRISVHFLTGMVVIEAI